MPRRVSNRVPYTKEHRVAIVDSVPSLLRPHPHTFSRYGKKRVERVSPLSAVGGRSANGRRFSGVRTGTRSCRPSNDDAQNRSSREIRCRRRRATVAFATVFDPVVVRISRTNNARCVK